MRLKSVTQHFNPVLYLRERYAQGWFCFAIDMEQRKNATECSS